MVQVETSMQVTRAVVQADVSRQVGRAEVQAQFAAQVALQVGQNMDVDVSL